MLAKRMNPTPAAQAMPTPPSVPAAPVPPLPKPEFKPARIESSVPAKKRSTPKVAEVRKQMRTKLLAAPNEADEWKRSSPDHQKIIRDRLSVMLQRANIRLSEAEVEELHSGLLDDLLGFGPIQSLVDDRSYSEIMVNGPDIIFVERRGKLIETDIMFDDNDHVLWTAARIARRIGRTIDRNDPMTDARLPDGSRVHLIIPPSAMGGPTITIRKFPEKVLMPQDLINFGSFTSEVADFLEACVVARMNIVVSGGTGSGKTTLLNALSSYIPGDERIVTIEDSAELQLSQRHVVRLETAPPVPGGNGKTGKLDIRDLGKASLRMRPDRIVIGECRSGEALDMLQAMNTGHDGSLTTVHSNSPRDAVARLETLALMAGMDIPIEVVRRQIASAVQLFVQQARLKDGSRKITQITELQGMEGESVTLQDLFVYKTADHRGAGPSAIGGGTLQATGFRPKFIDRLEQVGFRLSNKIFASAPGGFQSANR